MKILVNQEINDFLSNNALWIALGFIGLIAITIGTIVLVNYSRKNKTKKYNKANATNNFYEYIGGIDNVVSTKLVGSRFTIVLKNYDLVDKDKLKTLGVSSIISLKDKITLVLNDLGKDYFEYFK